MVTGDEGKTKRNAITREAQKYVQRAGKIPMSGSEKVSKETNCLKGLVRSRISPQEEETLQNRRSNFT